ncbi:MAG: hypothetical protein ABI857_10545 [Acidobacteriota bacterium]
MQNVPFNFNILKASSMVIATLFLVSLAPAQKTPLASPPIIFAVLNDGKLVEPIASVSGGKLVEPDLGSSDASPSKVFGERYYKPRSLYPIVFGGALDGALTITRSNLGSECGGATAEVVSRPIKAKLARFVMALATNVKLSARSTGYRRRPTPEERSEVESLVREEFRKKGAKAVAMRVLRYHNLTSIDVNGDGIPEFVGSYWIAPTAKLRMQIFFIAAQNASEKLEMVYNDSEVIKPDDVMTGDLKDLDDGRGSELLLDALDYDDDGVKEIFTIGQGFEGNNYYVYKLIDGKWTKTFETYRYYCAY